MDYEIVVTLGPSSNAESVWRDPQGVTLAGRLWDVLTANLPFAGGFATGFAVGFKLG